VAFPVAACLGVARDVRVVVRPSPAEGSTVRRSHGSLLSSASDPGPGNHTIGQGGGSSDQKSHMWFPRCLFWRGADIVPSERNPDFTRSANEWRGTGRDIHKRATTEQ
jgi:hypothetical protein